MGARLRQTSGPALAKPSDLVGMLTNLQANDVIFIDEIHRLPAIVEEFIYPAMEDFRVDFTVDSGMHARTINLPLKPFTLIGATTRAGLLTAPLRARFGIVHHLDFWSAEDLMERARRTAEMLNIKYQEKALVMLAARSRGTPRITNRLLRRVRDFAQIKADGQLTESVVTQALELEGIDPDGLDKLDHAFLTALIHTHRGGPAGIESIAASLGEERDTLEDVVEPFLLQRGLVARTRRGRVATPAAYKHLGLQAPTPDSSEETGLF
jgi:Holliday junction DNA helicase RuvB